MDDDRVREFWLRMLWIYDVLLVWFCIGGVTFYVLGVVVAVLADVRSWFE